MTEQELILACKQEKREAQKLLYDRYSERMFGVCRRYIKVHMDAEDCMVNGFYKVFKKLDQYSEKGNFEGWMRKIMVNECLMFLRKYNMNLSVELNESDAITETAAEEKIMEQDILKLLDHLPAGYRTVFNLFAIEGYSHKEIAEQLNISINTSKSQLIKARKKLQEFLKKSDYRVA